MSYNCIITEEDKVRRSGNCNQKFCRFFLVVCKGKMLKNEEMEATKFRLLQQIRMTLKRRSFPLRKFNNFLRFLALGAVYYVNDNDLPKTFFSYFSTLIKLLSEFYQVFNTFTTSTNYFAFENFP